MPPPISSETADAILDLRRAGLTRKQIAERLSIGTATVSRVSSEQVGSGLGERFVRLHSRRKCPTCRSQVVEGPCPACELRRAESIRRLAIVAEQAIGVRELFPSLADEAVKALQAVEGVV